MARLTATSKKKWLWLALPPVVAILVAMKTMNTSPPTNRSSTSPDATDAQLRTRVYPLPIDDVETAAKQVVLNLSTYGKSWSIPYTGRADETVNERSIDVEVPVIVFTDDLTVTLHSETENETRVDVVSQSRIGKGDFGENRRHILQFLEALDAKLGKSKAG